MRRVVCAALVLGVVVAVAGCGGGSSPPEKANAPDPLEQFKPLAKKLEASLTACCGGPSAVGRHGAEIEDSIVGWHGAEIEDSIVESVSYNVVKTDSLVSPYAGTIDFVWQNIAKFDTPKSGKPRLVQQMQYAVHVDYAYQDNKWVYKQMDFVLKDVKSLSERTPQDLPGRHVLTLKAGESCGWKRWGWGHMYKNPKALVNIIASSSEQ